MNKFPHIRILAAEQCILVELADRGCDIDDLAEPPVRFEVHAPLVLIGAAIVVGGQVRAKTRDCAQEENNIEVQILESFRMFRDTVDKALEVWAL